MSSSNFFTSITISVTLALILQTSFALNSPLSHICSTTENFTSYTPYESNLKTLVNSLIYKTPSTGFGFGSVGLTQYQNQQVYGLALCRGDVSTSECKICVSEATKEILNLCPYNKSAIIWYDNCMFKYSDIDFFGKIDNSNKFSLLNVQSVNDPIKFNNVTKDLLNLLASEASMEKKLYANGELKVGELERVYGQVQCTRDLSSDDCKKCLDDVISELPSCCDGKKGGRVVGGSCNVRYEIYPFVRE
ncbi:cysteine-rich repeat secretory protein 38-like [Vicia villosa]|uniref:cysteine-rich repeat secretory protein 38-like n=1 Tax=Vicia villosa TaxID=3911 RepID=UPI00273C27EF|nr:cysteine-rich repeat secretory protein 38-like [Vicia villosa]